jgi:hypothetical protein
MPWSTTTRRRDASLPRAKRERLALSGGKGDADSPLGLQLSNAAINILANTDRAKEVRFTFGK